MMQAPETPTTAELHAQFPIDARSSQQIQADRLLVGNIINGTSEGFLAIKGLCSLTEDGLTIRRESEDHSALMNSMRREGIGLYIAHRIPPWKPRTKQEDWHGLETNEPELAYATMMREARAGTGNAAELRYKYHAERYNPVITIGWIGSRAALDDGAKEDVEAIVLHDPKLSLGYKNALDGRHKPALIRLEELRNLRASNDAPLFYIYRGGENARDPQTWEEQYRDALELTQGKMVLDLAHGTEMAHAPNGDFTKSAEAQIRAMEHAVEIAQKGEMPNGIMMEASDVVSPTDPHMPHRQALQGIQALARLKHAA